MQQIVHDFLRDILSHERNAQRQNLLHFACSRNEYQLVEPLITKDSRLCQQDIMGRTPIHVAIDMDHTKCVLEFLKLLQKYDNLHERVQRDLCHIFKIYNHKGHTILHEAALKDMRDMVCEMLIFCKKQNIDVSHTEVLGCGDSLLHLMVRENLVVMAGIVCAFLPELVKYPNYGGLLPGEMECITPEMNIVLKNARKPKDETVAN